MVGDLFSNRMMRALPGTYALILLSSQDGEVDIGKLGALQTEPGYYIYIGSAFGPGGLQARVAHHRTKARRPHWHIDYLRPLLHLTEIWYTYDPVHREHQWAQTISATREAIVPLAGFGSSDCPCKAHLFFRNSKPSIKTFRRKMCAIAENHGKILLG